MTGAGRLLRPMYEALIGRPVREGRLRFSGMDGAERQLAMLAFASLIAMLVSILVSDLWRRGDLLPLSARLGQYHAVPEAVLPITLLAFLLAWAVIVWGATLASNWVTLAGAAAFLLLNASIGKPAALDVADNPVVRVAPTVARIAYFAAPLLMVVFSVFQRRASWRRRTRIPLLILLLTALAIFFGSLLALHVAQVRDEAPQTVPALLDGAVLAVGDVLLPLIVLSAVALIGFSYSVAEAAATPLWAARASVAKLIVLAFIAFKLWVQLIRHWSEWVSYAPDHPVTVASVLGSLGFLVVFALVLRRRRLGAPEGVEEGLIYGGTLLFSVPLLLIVAATMLSLFLFVQTGWFGAYEILRDHFPTAWLTAHGDAVTWLLALLAAAALVVWRRAGGDRAELWLGLLMMAAWVLLSVVPPEMGFALGWNDALADLVVTTAAVAWLLIGWRRIDAAAAARIGAVAVFSWIVFTRADFIAIAAGWFGLPAIVLVVFGVLYTLAADSAFVSGDSERLPRNARPLLWIGYLLLSATLLHWNLVTHSDDLDFSAGIAYNGFFLIGIPLAAWLLVRRPFRPPVRQ